MKYPAIYDQMCAMSPIPSESWGKFESGFEAVSFKKSQKVHKAGEEAQYIYFVISGIMRNYCLDINGREYTKSFRGKGGLIGPYAELVQNKPVRYNIQAITDVEAIRFRYSDYAKLLEEYPEWQKVGRIVAENNFIEKEWREYMLLQMNTQQRYDSFKEMHSDLAAHIPQYQIASYIGVTAESLNRILKKSISQKGESRMDSSSTL